MIIFWLLFLANSCTNETKSTESLFKSVTSQTDREDVTGRVYKEFQYEGETFKVFAPVNNNMTVEALGMTGFVAFSEVTHQYIGSGMSVQGHFDSPEKALEYVCKTMVNRSRRPDTEELADGLRSLFEKL